MSSSELPHLLHQYQRYLHRLDALEQRLEESITAKRQRAAGLLEILPTHRSSHLRIFVTHHVDEEIECSANSSTTKKQKWTLLLEGRLLVGYLDHESAFLTDQESTSSSLTTLSNVHIQPSTSGNALSTATAAAAVPMNANVPSNSTIANVPTAQTENTGSTGASSSNRLSRDFNRGFCDIDFDDPPPMIKFTHFFDKVSVSFQSFYRSKVNEGDDGGNGLKIKRAVKELSSSSSSSSSKRKSMDGENKHEPFIALGNITTLNWEREAPNTAPGSTSTTTSNALAATDDSHAFHIVYDDLSQDKETLLIVTIQLYKRLGSVDMYKPSEALAALLFPRILVEDERKKKAIAALTAPLKMNMGGDDLMSPKKKNRTSIKNDYPNNASQSNWEVNYGGVNENKAVLSSVPKYTTVPVDNDIYVPLLVTMEDIIGAILCYVKDRDLIDKIDPNMICNNAVLCNLFECNVMSLQTMKGLLLSRKLIEKVGVKDHPIVITYVMRKDGGVARVNDQIYESTVSLSGPKDVTTESPPQESTMNENEAADKCTSTTKITPDFKSIEGLHPNFLTFDMDVEVPTLFAYRTREILGRIKRREFEWTNARTKALRMVQASKVEEDLIKEKLEDIVKGRGLSKDHIPILLALARTSSGGSQAQICAHIDARTAFLVQRLEHHTNLAETCLETVEGLRNR